MPGLAFAALLAIAAKLAHELTGRAVSPVLCAIAAGILWRNAIGVGAWAAAGLEFAGQTLLRIGIALIGLRLTLAVLGDASVVALPVVLSCVAVAIAAALGLGRLFGVPGGLRQLLAAGTAICGCTAIIATAPLLRAEKAHIGIALTCIMLFGSIAMVGYPWLAGALFGSAVLPAGVFFGAAIQDTSQVVGAALIYSGHFAAPDAVAIAGLSKFLRTFGLVLLVPLAAWWGARGEPRAPDARAGLRREALPVFVLFFIGFAVLRTIGDGAAGARMAEWQALLGYTQQASEWLLLVGMAAVGLGVTFDHIREAGWRPVAVALLAAAATGATAVLWCLTL